MLEKRISIVRLICDTNDPRDARTVVVPSGSNAFYYVAKAIHKAKKMLEDPRVQRILGEILRVFTAESCMPTRRTLFQDDIFRPPASGPGILQKRGLTLSVRHQHPNSRSSQWVILSGE